MGEPSRKELLDELAELRLRLEEAEATLRAIRQGEVDALVVSGPEEGRIYTLEGADQSYRLLVESINEGAATLSRDGKILYANRRLAEMLKTPLERVIGSFFHNYLALRDRQWFEALLLQGHQGQNRGEVALQAADGALVPSFISLSNMPLEDSPDRVCLVVTDLTEQKRQEEILAVGRLCRAILEQAEQAIVVCNARGIITHASQAAQRLRGNLLMQQVEKALPLRLPVQANATGHPAEEAFPLARVLQGEIYQDLEAILPGRDGQEFHVVLNAGPLMDENGMVLGCVLSLTDITARKQAEEALRTQARILKSMAEGVTVTDSRGIIIYTNPAFNAMFGYSPGELVGQHSNILNHYPPEENLIVVKEILRQVNSTGVWFGEFHNRKKDGTAFFTSARVSALTVGAKKLFISVQEDITARKRAEQALRESRDDLNRAQAVARTGSWRLNVRENKLTWSEECCRIFGIPPKTPMTYETFLGTLHPEDRNYVHRQWMAALRGEPYNIEHRIIVGDQVKWVRERAQLEFDQKGRLVGGFGTTQDITERKQAEQELARQKELLQGIIDNIPVMLTIYDPSLKTFRFNQEFRKLLGWTEEEVDVDNPMALFYPDPYYRQQVQEFMQSLEPGWRDFQVTAKDGSVVDSAWANIRLTDDTQIGIGIDIRERKRAEESIKRQQAILQGINRIFHEALTCETEEDLGRTCLTVVEEITASQFGFISEINEAGLLDGIVISDPGWAACQMAGPEEAVLFRSGHIHGIYGWVLNNGQPLIANDPATHPDRIGVPEGHPRLTAFLGVPLKLGDRTIGLVGLGNKAGGYTSTDQEAAETLSVAIVEAFQRQRAEKALRRAYDKLEDLVAERTAALRLANQQLLWEIEGRRESEASFTAFMQHLPGAAVMRDIQGRYTFANEAWEQLAGKKRKEWLWNTADEIWPPELAKKFKDLDFHILSTGQAVEHIEELELADGRHYFLVNRFPILDESGLPYMVGAIAIDITARHQAEMEIERQAAVLNGIHRIFWEALTCETEEELGRTCLAVAEELTDSRFGFIDNVNDQGCFDALAFSDPGWFSCRIPDVADLTHLRNIKPVGLLDESIRGGKPLIANHPSTHPAAAGIPEGHPPLTAFLGMPLIYGKQTVGLIGLGNKAGGYNFTDQETMEILAPTIVEALMHHRARRDLKRSEGKMRRLADQLLTAQENERKRLAAELHDELGHALLTLKISLSSIAKQLLPEQENLEQEIQKQLAYINDVINEIRRLYHDLSPGDLEDLGLTRTLRTLVEDFAGLQKHIAWEVDLPDLDRLFPLPVQTIIYRLVQEALTNIGKHAHPERIMVSAAPKGAQVNFFIEDNGFGFDLSEVLDSASGLGLAAMEERLNMVGGSFRIWSEKGSGTRLFFSIPVLPENCKP
ncbi:MAG: PAS domain S-box protein [Desulfobacteraceae bacterium]